MDKLVKLAVTIGVLLAGIGVFYHYVIALPAIEREKLASAEREHQAAKLRETQRQLTYDACVARADRNYSANWATACKSVAEQRVADYRNCLVDKSVMANQFLGTPYCKRTYGDTDASPECSLPKARADSINTAHKQEQDRCVTEARLGL